VGVGLLELALPSRGYPLPVVSSVPNFINLAGLGRLIASRTRAIKLQCPARSKVWSKCTSHNRNGMYTDVSICLPVATITRIGDRTSESLSDLYFTSCFAQLHRGDSTSRPCENAFSSQRVESASCFDSDAFLVCDFCVSSAHLLSEEDRLQNRFSTVRRLV
jgi:hypothetical protein